MAIDDGGNAFPSAQMENVFVEELGRYDERLSRPQGGMSLRDYFAGQALLGIVSKAPFEKTAEPSPTNRMTLTAAGAYGYADAMLAERAKG